MRQNDLNKLLKELLQIPECEWIEYKKDNSNFEMIGEYLSALSNSACYKKKSHGFLIYGIDDDTREVIGTSFNPLTAKKGGEELKSWLLNRLSPRIDFEMYYFKYEDNDIALFSIPATTNQPVSFLHKRYIRIGSYKKDLKDYPEIEKAIWYNTKTFVFEKEITQRNVNEEKILEVIDYNKFIELLKLNPIFERDAILKKLEEYGFIIKKGKSFAITNLGAILFAKNLNDFESLSRKSIRVIIYKGNSRVDRIKEYTNNRGYAIEFEYIINYINDNLTNEKIGKAYRTDSNPYPERAIRELVANSIIHQDFDPIKTKGTSVAIEVFSNRIEFSNPGRPLIDTQHFIDHKPQSRNEKLAKFMRDIDICEESGTGIDKVITDCETYKLPAPDFIANDNNTNVILYAPKTLRQLDLSDKIRACYQHCVLKYVERKDMMTNQTLRERFNIKEKNYSTASRIIKATIEAGFIKEYNPENKAKRYTKYIPEWA
jgi:ATP-dependent DNA helicase RecG